MVLVEALPAAPRPRAARCPSAIAKGQATQAERQAWLATKPTCVECQGPITTVAPTGMLPRMCSKACRAANIAKRTLEKRRQAGLCQNGCGRKRLPDGSRCALCKAASKVADKKVRDKRIEALKGTDLCRDRCGRTRTEGFTTCGVCRERRRLYESERRGRSQHPGLCGCAECVEKYG